MDQASPNQSDRHPEKKAAGETGQQGSPEEQQAASEAGAASEDNKALREELEQTRKELHAASERLDQLTRSYASLVNDQKDFRTRLEREKQRVLQTERGNIALQLIEIADEIERALGSASGDDPIAHGVRMIHEGLGKRLSAMGIERISLVGKPFDANLAEAVDLVPVDDPALDDSVIAESLPGYRLGDRVLRAAKVRVARHVAPAKSAPSEEPAQAGSGSEADGSSS
jgi:molecular chaperone GrpE